MSFETLVIQHRFFIVFYIFAVDDENEYTVYVKDNKYAIEDSLKCNTVTYNGVGTIQTIPFVCRQPLKGKYIHIVSLESTTLRVHEIEQFGKKFKQNHPYLFCYAFTEKKIHVYISYIVIRYCIMIIYDIFCLFCFVEM